MPRPQISDSADWSAAEMDALSAISTPADTAEAAAAYRTDAAREAVDLLDATEEEGDG